MRMKTSFKLLIVKVLGHFSLIAHHLPSNKKKCPKSSSSARAA
jgi:hypothetical protein